MLKGVRTKAPLKRWRTRLAGSSIAPFKHGLSVHPYRSLSSFIIRRTCAAEIHVVSDTTNYQQQGHEFGTVYNPVIRHVCWRTAFAWRCFNVNRHRKRLHIALLRRGPRHTAIQLTVNTYCHTQVCYFNSSFGLPMRYWTMSCLELRFSPVCNSAPLLVRPYKAVSGYMQLIFELTLTLNSRICNICRTIATGIHSLCHKL